MINDYSEPVDTIKLARESPHLDRITDFSKSKSVSKKMWGNLIDGVNYLDQNEYGKKILENIPNKGLHFNHSKSLNVPGQINKNEKSITFSDESPQLSQQSEELIHAAQFNKYYGGKGSGYQNIPGINLETESKILQDIIAAKNYLKTDDSDNLKYIGSKFFIEGSFSKEENFKLGKKYFDIIMDIATTDSINKKDLKFLNSISSKTSKEKSNHDHRDFNEAIEPKLIKSLFSIKE